MIDLLKKIIFKNIIYLIKLIWNFIEENKKAFKKKKYINVVVYIAGNCILSISFFDSSVLPPKKKTPKKI